MVGGPLGRKCKTNGSICSKVEEKRLEAPVPTSVSSVRRSPVLSSKKDTTHNLKKNSSLAFSTKVLCGKETESTPELRSAETRNRSSFSAPTISSSRKTNTEKQNGNTKFSFLSCPPLDEEQYTLIKHDFLLILIPILAKEDCEELLESSTYVHTTNFLF